MCRRIFLYMWDLTQISWRALRLNVPEHSTTFEIAKFGQNILCHYCRVKREKGYMHQAIESESDVISHNTRAVLQGNTIIIL